MPAQSGKNWYGSWWAMVLAMLLGSLVGWLLKGCYLGVEPGLNL